MKPNPRLLGLAFASADILLELTPDGEIAFALGSAPAPDCLSPESWRGLRLNDFLGKASRSAFASATKGLADGARTSLVDILLVCDETQARRARIRAFRLPELAPALSCAIIFDGAAFPLELPSAPRLLDGDAFLDRSRQNLERAAEPSTIAVAFVDVPGLAVADGEDAQRAGVRIQAALQAASVDGSSAARLAPERFALLRHAEDGRDVAVEVFEAAAAEGLDLSPLVAQALIPRGADIVSTLKALRFTIEGCLQNAALEHPERLFSQTLKTTLRQADQFRVAVRARQFALHYQPIVDLGSGAVHHFEALARFGPESPAQAISMAEDLGLIEDFDLAVLEKALHKARQPGNGLIKLAVNVSAASLATDTYVNALLRLTAGDPLERRRLMIEVTETAAMQDVEAANRRLEALRTAGVKVCIDDFGVGSAGFDYLRGLSVDAVKIDGSFVRDLDTDRRAQTLIRHLVELCASLKLTTVAEMIETGPVAEAVLALGIDQGQGWLFGKPMPEPQPAAVPGSSPARRAGAVTSWA